MSFEALSPYAVLAQFILSLLPQLGIFYKCYQLAKEKKIQAETSFPTMKLFFWYLFLQSFVTIILYVFMIITWRPTGIPLSERTIYLTGIWSYLLVMANPIFDFFLCLERCWVICSPIRYDAKYKNYLCGFTIIFAIAFTALTAWFANLYVIPEPDVYGCIFFTCALHKHGDTQIMIFRIIAAILDISAAVLLCFLMKFKIVYLTDSKKAKNRIILLIICVTIVLEFCPSLLDFTMNQLHLPALISLIGPYRTTVSSLDLLIIIIMYGRMFKKPKTTNKVTSINNNNNKSSGVLYF